MKKVYFVSGLTSRPGTCGLIAYLNELKDRDAEFSQFYTVSDGVWGHREIKHQIVSLSYDPEEPAWYLLSKRGTIVILSRSGTREEQIPEAGTGPGRFGYVNQIRRLDGQMFVCGYNRQVYRRDPSGWVRADRGIRCDPKRPGIGFLTIGGFEEDELYAAGRHGDLQRFDGTRWHSISSPTNSFLRAICVGPAEACAAGGEGVVLAGRHDQWDLVPLASDVVIDSFYDVANFRGQTVLSAYEGLFMIRSGMIVPWPDPLPPDTRCYRLAASQEELWVIGHDRIFVFDGEVWREEVCPDNL